MRVAVRTARQRRRRDGERATRRLYDCIISSRPVVHHVLARLVEVDLALAVGDPSVAAEPLDLGRRGVDEGVGGEEQMGEELAAEGAKVLAPVLRNLTKLKTLSLGGE